MKPFKRKDSCTFKRETSLDNQERIYQLAHQKPPISQPQFTFRGQACRMPLPPVARGPDRGEPGAETWWGAEVVLRLAEGGGARVQSGSATLPPCGGSEDFASMQPEEVIHGTANGREAD